MLFIDSKESTCVGCRLSYSDKLTNLEAVALF